MIEFYCPNCGSDDIIRHSVYEWQCRQCGKYVAKNYIDQYAELSNLGLFAETEEPKIAKMLKESKAKPLMTLYTPNTVTRDAPNAKRTTIYEKSDHSYIGIEMTEIPHTLPLGEFSNNKNFKMGTYRSPQVKILTSTELPKLRYHQPHSFRQTSRQVVGYTQSEVFEGISVGGAISGGTRTVVNPQYETVHGRSYSGDYYTLEWDCKNISTDGKKECWSTEAATMFLYSPVKEKRYAPAIKKWEGTEDKNLEFYYIEADKPLPDIKNMKDYAFSFAFPIIWRELLSGEINLTDAEYYKKACDLLNSDTGTGLSYANLQRAAVMFELLGDYEDSKLKLETCWHKASKYSYDNSNREERSFGEKILDFSVKLGNVRWGWVWVGIILLTGLASSCGLD